MLICRSLLRINHDYYSARALILALNGTRNSTTFTRAITTAINHLIILFLPPAAAAAFCTHSRIIHSSHLSRRSVIFPHRLRSNNYNGRAALSRRPPTRSIHFGNPSIRRARASSLLLLLHQFNFSRFIFICARRPQCTFPHNLITHSLWHRTVHRQGALALLWCNKKRNNIAKADMTRSRES
jgi:hypothetical protein